MQFELPFLLSAYPRTPLLLLSCRRRSSSHFPPLPNTKRSSGGGGVSGGGNGKVPPLGASSSAEGDGDKKKAAGLGILWVAYNSLLESQPILAKSLTSMTGFGLGDLLAQKFLEKKVGFDLCHHCGSQFRRPRSLRGVT